MQDHGVKIRYGAYDMTPTQVCKVKGVC